jgi:hypothetical protein
MTKYLSIAALAVAFSASFAGSPAHAIGTVQPMVRVAAAASGTQQAEAEGARNGAVSNAKAEAHDFNEGKAQDI